MILIFDICGYVAVNVYSVMCEAIGLGEYGCPYYACWYGYGGRIWVVWGLKSRSTTLSAQWLAWVMA